MHPRYQEWIRYVFDHPAIQPEWYWELDAPYFKADPIDEAVLIDLTFRRAARDLAPFSDARVNQGLWYLTSPGCCDHMRALRSDVVPLDTRLSAIAAIGVLYRECFARRCSRTLSHLDERPCSELNAICYMFWDVTPINYLEGFPDRDALADACFAVLADTLSMDHLACQEAAIHGYGEMAVRFPGRVAVSLDRYLQDDAIDSRLRAYATRARTGHIL